MPVEWNSYNRVFLAAGQSNDNKTNDGVWSKLII
jgi:hypothetical protein